MDGVVAGSSADDCGSAAGPTRSIGARVMLVALACSALVAGCDAAARSSSTSAIPASVARPTSVSEAPSAVVDAAAAPGRNRVQEPLSPAARERVERFCSACHHLPDPRNFPRRQWPQEVRLGFDLYQASLRTDLSVPPEADAIRYFQEGAPEALEVPRAADRDEAPTTVDFLPVALEGMVEQPGPAVAQVLVEPRTASGTKGISLLTTDMRSGEIRRFRLDGTRAESRLLVASGHPCRLTAVPEAPGRWFLGDLGSYMPEDHDFGSVAMLVEGGAADGAVPGAVLEPLREGLSRVVEALPLDHDGEGDRDLLVLEFGWRRSGALRVLLGAGAGGLPIGQRVVDPRHGCLAGKVADLDGDGRDDIVAAFAQEHETVDVWYGRGGGAFDHRQIHRFRDPSWGTSGLDVADLDGDGDLDILHCNGDTMDSGLARPNHGVRVLWNEGGKAFRVEEIAVMPGVSQATAADMDGDGDMDVVASAFHPSVEGHAPGTFDSMIWVEQSAAGWRTRSIERDRCEHAAFALVDIDGDGRKDIAAGTFRADPSGSPQPLVRVWLNRERD